MKRQLTEWDKTFANNATYKGLIYKIYKQLKNKKQKQINNKKKTNQKKKTPHRMGENFCKQCNLQGPNLQNIQTTHNQTTHAVQYPKINNPIKK